MSTTLASCMGNWIGAGTHIVTIRSVDHGTTEKGATFVELEVQDRRGRSSKIKFWISDRATFRFAEFVYTTGLTDDEFSQVTVANCGDYILGRRVGIVMSKEEGSKYTNITSWFEVQQGAVKVPVEQELPF